MHIEIARSGTSTQLFWVGEVSILLPTLYYSYLTSQGLTQPGDSQAWAWQHDEFPKTPFSKWWANIAAVSLVNDGFLCLHFSPDIELRPASPLLFLFFCKLFIQGGFRYMCPPRRDLIWQIYWGRRKSRPWDWAPWVKWMLHCGKSQLIPRKCN